jgi:hypothetical protein
MEWACCDHPDAPGWEQTSALARLFDATVRPFRYARVLIVARRTAESGELIKAVTERADRGPCNFTLLVPSAPLGRRSIADPRRYERDADAERRIAAAVPLLSRAADSEVVAVVGAHDPVAAVTDALALMGFDEVIVSMLPARVSRWRALGLPGRIRALGVPVTEVTGAESPSGSLARPTRPMSPERMP